MIPPADYTKLSPKERRELREQYIEQQRGKCMYCKSELSQPPPLIITDKWVDWTLFPPDFLKHPIHLQHHHKTGLTEGAVHAYCNAVMWLYENR